MDNRQIEKELDRLFEKEERRIVIWNDPEKEFVGTLPELRLPKGVEVLELDQYPALEVKIRIEQEEPKGRYLLYSPQQEPDYENDWLLDIRLYSQPFHADRAAIILSQLGLVNLHLREHIAKRLKFFDHKQRLEKLKSLVAADDIEMDLDRKMITVLAKADQPEWFNIVRTLYHEFTIKGNGEEIDLDDPPEHWLQIEKFDLDEAFWRMAESIFGYSEENPCLRNFLLRLMVTDFVHHLKGDAPEALAHLSLPPTGKSNAMVCLAQWRDSSSKGSSYDWLSEQAGDILKIDDLVFGFEMEDLLNVMTFQVVEKRIAQRLKELVLSRVASIDADKIRSLAAQRQDGHWVSAMVAGSGHVPRAELHAVYAALIHAAEYFAMKNSFPQGFDYDDAGAMYKAYEETLFRFDQLYRNFCEQADIAEAKTWDILKDLRAEVEACYVNGYVQDLASRWGKFIDPERAGSLLSTWEIRSVNNQQGFYKEYVAPRMKKTEKLRTFVIISDALRYEAAEELTRGLNGKYRFTAELSSHLGVIPSTTSLGKASLLPHKKLEYNPKGKILVDGQPTDSLEQRNHILSFSEGLAVNAIDLMEMKKNEGRALVKDKRVVYIYHDVIDAAGDHAQSEYQTFKAVRQAISGLESLVTYIINTLNGHHIFITADHGFLYNETAPGEPDKSDKINKPPGTVKTTKRYIIGRDLGAHDRVWQGSTHVTAGAEGDMEFWIPKGTNRFHFVGGAKFFHGGAMLQEIVVPIVTVRHLRGKSAAKSKTKQVRVNVLGSNHIITASRHRFDLIQMEPVTERVKPTILKVAIYEENEPVTNIETLTFESRSDKYEERTKSVTLVLQRREYNKKTKYKLIMRDAESGVGIESTDIIIDRAFNDDF